VFAVFVSAIVAILYTLRTLNYQQYDNMLLPHKLFLHGIDDF